MKIKVEYSPEEVAQAVIAFGLDTELNGALLHFAGLTKESCTCGKFTDEQYQLIYGHVAESTDDLELYATAKVELIDGRITTMQDFDDMFYEGGEFYKPLENGGVEFTHAYIMSKVKGAVAEFEIENK